MLRLRRLGPYTRRVIGGKWSIVTFLATLTAANWDRLVSAVAQDDVHQLTAVPVHTNWTAVVIVLGVCLLGLLIYRVFVLESEKEPMLILKFDGAKDEYRRTASVSMLPAIPALYVLVLPVVKSKTNLKRCVGRLAEISVLRNGRWSAVAYGTSLNLRWQDRGLDPLTLHPEGTSRQFLDVFSLRSDRNWIEIENLPRVIENEINLAPKFRLAISVVAEDEEAAGGSARIVLEVEKTTDWNAPKIRQVRDVFSDA